MLSQINFIINFVLFKQNINFITKTKQMCHTYVAVARRLWCDSELITFIKIHKHYNFEIKQDYRLCHMSHTITYTYGYGFLTKLIGYVMYPNNVCWPNLQFLMKNVLFEWSEKPKIGFQLWISGYKLIQTLTRDMLQNAWYFSDLLRQRYIFEKTCKWS